MLNKKITQQFSISYSYGLYFTNHLFDSGNRVFVDILENYKPGEAIKLLFVVDSQVADLHTELLPEIRNYCSVYGKQLYLTDIIQVPGGEHCKNSPEYVELVLRGIDSQKICRHSFVVAIGGGAIIDMVGYAAAIAHRGVKLIRIPTTVLSQNDSAVGVKNSVNAFSKKNFLGTFAPPYAIINDFNFLGTLEQRDWVAGVAEAVKVALIKDADFFKYLEANAEKVPQRDTEVMDHIIYECAKIHMEHIAKGGDPFESGSSRPLDFGHWSAHKLEQMTGYELRHGEAVAKGIALDVVYSQLIGLISENTASRILNVMQALGMDLHLPISGDEGTEQLLKGIQEFREHLGGELTITLLSDIGIKHDVHRIDMDLMKQAIAKCNSLREIPMDS